MTEPTPRPPRLLVADDEESIRRLVTRILRTKSLGLSSVEVVQAGSAEEAIEILEREAVDIVLTDYRMTGKTGAELLAEVEDRWPETQRVLMTGYVDVAEQAPDELAASAVIRKPWNNEAFVQTLRSLLEDPRR